VYRNDVRRELSHCHRQHAQQYDEVWPWFSSYASRQTDKQTCSLVMCRPSGCTVASGIVVVVVGVCNCSQTRTSKCRPTCLIFTRDSVAIARISHGNSICPSVRPSVRLSHGWISQKRLKLGSRNFHHTVAPSL